MQSTIKLTHPGDFNSLIVTQPTHSLLKLALAPFHSNSYKKKKSSGEIGTGKYPLYIYNIYKSRLSMVV
jgi:hypothetical protein